MICVQVYLGKVIRKSANLAVGGGKSAGERETDRQTDRQSDRQTDRQTESMTLAEPTPDMTERKCFSNVLTARVLKSRRTETTHSGDGKVRIVRQSCTSGYKYETFRICSSNILNKYFLVSHLNFFHFQGGQCNVQDGRQKHLTNYTT